MRASKEETGVDLDALAGSVQAQERGREVRVIHPATNEPLGLTVVVAGLDSERYRLAWRAELRALVEAGSLGDVPEAEDLAGKRRIAAASVISWSPDPVLGGKSLPCTQENALKVLTAVPSIFDQCWGAIVDRAGFTTR